MRYYTLHLLRAITFAPVLRHFLANIAEIIINRCQIWRIICTECNVSPTWGRSQLTSGPSWILGLLREVEEKKSVTSLFGPKFHQLYRCSCRFYDFLSVSFVLLISCCTNIRAGLTIVPVVPWKEAPQPDDPRSTAKFYHAVLTFERLVYA